MGLLLTLITGRTREQAIGMHKGKDSIDYRRAAELAEMNLEDMERLRIQDGDSVRLRSESGHVELKVKAGSLSPGLVFVPMGPSANALVATETQGTGMPSFKGMEVEVVSAGQGKVAP